MPLVGHDTAERVNMSIRVSRREVVSSVVVAALTPGVVAAMPRRGVVRAEGDVPPGFPHQDLKLVREVVGASHGNEAKVRELVGVHPALVNGWWDWGFGDWESPLGAASHVGNRAIAEFLIASGARVDLFAAAMLGWTEVVRGFVEASQGVQRTLGPHGITLLAHAKAGGERAAETLNYLESLGDAGASPAIVVLSDEKKAQYAGWYSMGGEPERRFEIKVDAKKQLQFAMLDEAARPIHHLGNHEFFPAGVPSTRFKFTMENGAATRVEIVTKGWSVVGRRMS